MQKHKNSPAAGTRGRAPAARRPSTPDSSSAPTVAIPIVPVPARQVVDRAPSKPALRLVDQVALGVNPAPELSRPDAAMRVLRHLSGQRPPLILPVTENARAAASAAVVEFRVRMAAVTGESEQQRSPLEVADAVLGAASPFIQRDLINRVLADRLWMMAALIGGSTAAAGGLVAGIIGFLMAGVPWMVALLGCALLVLGFCTGQMAAGLQRGAARARALAQSPLTEEQADRAAETIDLSTAAKRDAAAGR